MARALSEMVKQYSVIPRGSTSPILAPFLTCRSFMMHPRNTPLTADVTGLLSTRHTESPLLTAVPIIRPFLTTPSQGALKTRFSVYPRTGSGIPVFAAAAPFSMILPRLCPLMVSMTMSTSLPAVNPGPRAMVSGARFRLMQVFFFDKVASTRTCGWMVFKELKSGSTRTGTHLSCQSSFVFSGSGIRTAAVPSTSILPE